MSFSIKLSLEESDKLKRLLIGYLVLQLQDLNVCSVRAAVETMALIRAYVLLAVKVLPVIVFEYIWMNLLS